MRTGFLILCFIVIKATVYGQEQSNFVISPSQLQSVIPTSPNAAALGKYGAIPVGQYTGIPSISIPLYEINTGKLKLPISISYHAAGIKVEEMASWVGLGWSLNAGGAIVRQVRGRPDESSNGYLQEYPKIMKFMLGQMTSSEAIEYLSETIKGNIDAQPDIFTYNFPGGSGSFFFDTTGNILTVPRSNLEIEGGMGSWGIVDAEGNRYSFTVAEETTTTPNTGGQLSSTVDGYFGPSITSIYLQSIYNASGTDSIIFEYDSYLFSFTTISSQTKYLLNTAGTECASKDLTNVSSTNQISGKRLRRIKFKNGEILFNVARIPRIDLVGDYPLDNIVIKNSDSSFYKRIQLYTHYSQSNGYNPPYGDESAKYFRLVLDSIKTFSKESLQIDQHIFDYNPMDLPDRKSFSQDHWGYYNGVQNGNFVPTTILTAPTGRIVVQGANRNTSTFSSNGMLNKITYPTGGSTNFVYENNIIRSTENFTNALEYNYRQIGYILGQTWYTDTFTLTDAAEVTIELSTSSCGGGQASLECPLVDISTTGAVYPIPASVTTELPAGFYTISANLSGVTDTTILNMFYLSVRWPKKSSVIYNGVEYYQFPAGGHRIKSIFDTDQNGTVYNKRTYEYNLPGTTLSSGTVLSLPQYMADITEHQTKVMTDVTLHLTCNYLTLSSASNLPLLSTKGGSVGYSFVRELNGDNGENGLTEYTFLSPAEVADFNYSQFPFAPSASFEWKRGMLIKEVKKKKENGNYIPVEKKTFGYGDKMEYSVQGLKAGTRTYNFSQSVYEHQFYPTSTGWRVLLSDTTWMYSSIDSTKFLKTINSYDYSENAFLPNVISSSNSKGQAMILRTKYAADYSEYNGNENDAKAIQELKNRNMLAIPIEKKVIKQNSSGSFVSTGGSYSTFKVPIAQPDTIWELQAIANNTDTSLSSIVANGITKSSGYIPVINFLRFDANENIIEQRKVDDIIESYIWGYNGAYPIAKVTNGIADSIAYTSFEDNSNGNWIISSTERMATDAITGEKSYQLQNGSISKSNVLTGKRFVISYWSKNSAYSIAGATINSTKTGRTVNGWTYYEHLLITTNSTVTISGSGSIDELRLYGPNMQMTSFTYRPLVGVTSQCDINNRFTTYEYDGIGRLRLIRDQDKNILKSFDYKYQQAQQTQQQ